LKSTIKRVEDAIEVVNLASGDWLEANVEVKKWEDTVTRPTGVYESRFVHLYIYHVLATTLQ
jgi:hypothetical protein